MKLGLVPLPLGKIYTHDSLFDHLHGWWIPPSFVVQFWCSGCYIHYTDEEDYQLKSEVVKASFIDAVEGFWSLMAY